MIQGCYLSSVYFSPPPSIPLLSLHSSICLHSSFTPYFSPFNASLLLSFPPLSPSHALYLFLFLSPHQTMSILSPSFSLSITLSIPTLSPSLPLSLHLSLPLSPSHSFYPLPLPLPPSLTITHTLCPSHSLYPLSLHPSLTITFYSPSLSPSFSHHHTLSRLSLPLSPSHRHSIPLHHSLSLPSLYPLSLHPSLSHHHILFTFSLSLPPPLSLSHTHTHTHTLSITRYIPSPSLPLAPSHSLSTPLSLFLSLHACVIICAIKWLKCMGF